MTHPSLFPTPIVGGVVFQSWSVSIGTWLGCSQYLRALHKWKNLFPVWNFLVPTTAFVREYQASQLYVCPKKTNGQSRIRFTSIPSPANRSRDGFNLPKLVYLLILIGLELVFDCFSWSRTFSSIQLRNYPDRCGVQCCMQRFIQSLSDIIILVV